MVSRQVQSSSVGRRRWWARHDYRRWQPETHLGFWNQINPQRKNVSERSDFGFWIANRVITTPLYPIFWKASQQDRLKNCWMVWQVIWIRTIVKPPFWGPILNFYYINDLWSMTTSQGWSLCTQVWLYVKNFQSNIITHFLFIFSI